MPPCLKCNSSDLYYLYEPNACICIWNGGINLSWEHKGYAGILDGFDGYTASRTGTKQHSDAPLHRFAYPGKEEFLGHWEAPCSPRICVSLSHWGGLRCAVLTTEEEWECSTLVDFFTESALLSLLEVLAALGELRPLERMSSLIGEALPSGLAGCFLRPLRSVDIYWFDRKESLLKPAFGQTLHLGISFCLVHGWITPAKSLRNGKPRALNTGTAFPWKLIWA